MLQPTREMIHQAWCMGLEYNIGTSAMGLNTLTVIAETCGKPDWRLVQPAADGGLRLLPADDESEITDLQAEHEARDGRQGGGGAAHAFQLNPDALRLPELTRVFEKSSDTMSEDDIKRKKKQLEAKARGARPSTSTAAAARSSRTC